MNHRRRTQIDKEATMKHPGKKRCVMTTALLLASMASSCGVDDGDGGGNDVAEVGAAGMAGTAEMAGAAGTAGNSETAQTAGTAGTAETAETAGTAGPVAGEGTAGTVGPVADAGSSGDGPAACPEGSYWDITYDLPESTGDPGTAPADPPADQNVLTLRDTMMGIGDANRNVGPGTATIRFESIDGSPGGRAYLLQLEISVNFTVPPATTNLVGTAGHEYDTGPCGAAAVGTVQGDVLTWSDFTGTAQGTSDPPNLHGYIAEGTITCDGPLCGTFGAPPQGTTDKIDGPYDIRFEPWRLSADAGAFFAPCFVTQQDLNSTVRLQAYGVESSRECVTAQACE